MSWFTQLFAPVLHIFGVGKQKDIPIPNPLPGAEYMVVLNEDGERGAEAIAAIRGFVRMPYQIKDRVIRVQFVSFDEGKAYFVRRGNKPSDWPKNRIAMSYAPKSGFNESHGLIHLISVKLDQPDRVRLALHEYGHLFWHWLMTAPEWDNWQSQNGSYEAFADDFARRMLGEKLDRKKEAFFARLEDRLNREGSKAERQ